MYGMFNGTAVTQSNLWNPQPQTFGGNPYFQQPMQFNNSNGFWGQQNNGNNFSYNNNYNNNFGGYNNNYNNGGNNMWNGGFNNSNGMNSPNNQYSLSPTNSYNSNFNNNSFSNYNNAADNNTRMPLVQSKREVAHINNLNSPFREFVEEDLLRVSQLARANNVSVQNVFNQVQRDSLMILNAADISLDVAFNQLELLLEIQRSSSNASRNSSCGPEISGQRCALIDSTGDGIYDTLVTEVAVDTNGTGFADKVVQAYQGRVRGSFVNQIQEPDSPMAIGARTLEVDTTGDGNANLFVKQTVVDTSGDGQADSVITAVSKVADNNQYLNNLNNAVNFGAGKVDNGYGGRVSY